MLLAVSTELTPAQTSDFGDAPAVYPTLLANNGARHALSQLFLGALLDPEPDGQPGSGADGDDLNPPGLPDDEDGVFFNTAFISGVPGTITVISSGPGLLQGWVDINRNGSWADSGEQIIANLPVQPGVNLVPYAATTFSVPSTGAVTYARFRLATQGGLGFTGAASDGEVEDYRVKLDALKWLQPPDLSPQGVDVNNEFELADDFLCTQSGPITDVHVWGSFLADEQGVPSQVLTNMTFVLKFYTDMPVGHPNNPLPYSHPDKLVWQTNIPPGRYQAGRTAAIFPIGEWWHTPPGVWQPNADHYCYQFDFYFDRTNAFRQVEGNVYWLSVQCLPNSPLQFGWKSTDPTNHWNDDAVWASHVTAPWGELRYGDGHPYANPLPGLSLDLAFALSTQEEEEPGNEDFGDAPDPSYPTLLASNGARHTILPGVTLGANIDSEADGQPNANATGDDVSGPVNDEDGVQFAGTLIPGQPYNILVTASVAGFLNAWVDFNADNSWAQPTDQIFSNQPLTPGANALVLSVPANATWGTKAFARFRFTTATNNIGYVGLAPDGEVEDYMMTTEPFPQHDLGDAPASLNNFGLAMTAYPSGVIANFPTALVFPGPMAPIGPIHLQPTNWAFLGANVTFESNADIGSDQDLLNNILPGLNTPDRDGGDDGVVLPLTLPHCRNTVLNYSVTFTAPPPAPGQMFVNIWFDWNRDGDWNDVMQCPNGATAPEWAVQNQIVSVPPGPYPAVNMIPSLPFRAWHPSLTNQPIWMRITLAEQMWPPPGGAMPVGGEGPINGYQYGETEDCHITDYDLDGELDFGDAPSLYPTLLAANGARHYVLSGFSLGAQIDSEADGLPEPKALGDDNNNLADEDGIKWITPLRLGGSACLSVWLTGPLGGQLDAWVDFDGNSNWEHPAERVFNGVSLTNGLNTNLCFNIPSAAKLGDTFARFRLSGAGGLLPTGVAADGEVEDYLVRICQTPPSTNVTVTSIAVTNAGSQQVVALTWNAETGVRYQVQQATTFSNTPPVIWSDLGSEITGPANSLVVTNSSLLERYYRIKVPQVCP